MSTYLTPRGAPTDDDAGIGLYAHMRDGTYLVGTTGTTLRAARRILLDERGYPDVPDPYYATLQR